MKLVKWIASKNTFDTSVKLFVDGLETTSEYKGSYDPWIMVPEQMCLGGCETREIQYHRGLEEQSVKNAYFGCLAEVGVWGTVRSPEQIADNLFTTPGDQGSDLLVYYPMRKIETSAKKVEDRVGIWNCRLDPG